MKVLIVTPHIFAGGAEKAILNMVFNLNKIGCTTSIATLSTDLKKLPKHLAKIDYILPDEPIEPQTMDGLARTITSSFKVFKSLVSLAKKNSKNYDLICGCNFPSYWATYFARTRKPTVWISSEVLGPYNQTKDVYDRSGLFRLALRIVTVIDKRIVDKGPKYIVTCSELNRRLLKGRYNRDAIVLPTGVDYDFFNEQVENPKKQVHLGNGPLLLQVGALIQRKNQILSVQALRILKSQLPNATLVLVGEGPWKPLLDQEAQKLGVQNNVVFKDSITEEELRTLYQACDVNLFPVKDQTWGLVPFEALAAGKPSIITKDTGAAEVMGRQKIGFLINQSTEELAKGVLYALESPEVVEDMVNRGQIYIKENLSWEKYAKDILDVFRRTLYDKN